MLIGLIRYCSKVLELHNEDFNAYAATTDMAHDCQKNIDTWDDPIGPLYGRRLQPFTDISKKILIANPRRVRPPWNLDTAITIFLDASKIGWGGIALFPNGAMAPTLPMGIIRKVRTKRSPRNIKRPSTTKRNRGHNRNRPENSKCLVQQRGRYTFLPQNPLQICS